MVETGKTAEGAGYFLSTCWILSTWTAGSRAQQSQQSTLCEEHLPGLKKIWAAERFEAPWCGAMPG